MRHMKVMALSLKNEGMLNSYRRYGWRLVSLVVTYYLVRDVALYILLPYLITQGF